MPGPAVVLPARFLASSPSFRLFPLPVFHPDLTTFNPAIAEHDGRIYFCVRHSNLLLTANERYGFVFGLKDKARDIVNETSFGIVQVPDGSGPLGCELFAHRLPEFEDLRIFRHTGRWLGLACVAERQVTDGFPFVNAVRMHLLSFDDRLRLQNSLALPSPYNAAREKNWVPFASPADEGLQIAYRPSPLELYAWRDSAAAITPSYKAEGPASTWSNGSAFVPYRNGHLAVIHRRSVLAGEFVYEHAFMRVASDFSVRISTPFHLLTVGVEFCAGLVVRANDVVLSFGSHNDSRAFLATLSHEDVGHWLA